MTRVALLLLACLILPFPAHAQHRDSYYYMKDDGVQSPEEMQMEAQTIFNECDSNVYQSRYFDCACLAGAFLQKREQYGGIAPQEEIINNLTIGNNVQCANTVAIAGGAYSQCMEFSARFREYDKDNEQYCSCVGNTVANTFKKTPMLNTSYISALHSDALVKCHNRDERNNPMPGQGG